jgi:hypothetical protein
MVDSLILKENYYLAKCCRPVAGDKIAGFLKLDSPLISVHRADCPSLAKVDSDRLVNLTWAEILVEDIKVSPADDPDFTGLDKTDFQILKHHQVMGVDYAAVVAKTTGFPRATVFARHRKLRDLGLLKRVQPVMIQYRKGIVKNKWIKHRNHTYYEITSKGEEFLDYFENTQ